jgi:dipeptidyl aminopeptidase/acylaminoacyl peptidase
MTAAILCMATLASVIGQQGERRVTPDYAVSEDVSPAETVYVRSSDGAYIGAGLRKPQGDGPFPAVLFVHGGLGGARVEGQVSSTLQGRVQNAFLKEGYVIMCTDYRRHDFGLREIDDVVAAFEYLQRVPEVDAKRVGIIGGSHGGYLTMRAITKVRPAAAVSFAGLVDIAKLFSGRAPEEPKGDRPSAAGEISWELYQRFGATSDEKPEPYREISVDTYADDIECPLLYCVGTADRLMEHGQMLTDLLKKKGKTCELATFPDMPHGFYWGKDPNDKPQAEFENCLKKTMEFVNRHVRGR